VARSLGYRSILVPLADNADTERALDVACKLAAEHGAKLVALAVVEVPPLLPLDAHKQPEEAAAHRLLERARAFAESYGVHFVQRVVRGREAATPVVELARAERSELIVMGTPRRTRSGRDAPAFGHTTQSILKRAPCRVMVLAAPARVVPVLSAPEWRGESSSSAAVRSS
jgi:nucleotide-binding universal stress UspA family protein